MGTVDPKDRGVVLVVDDDDDYRQVVRDILERQRYFVLDAHDGGEALDVLRSEAARAIRLQGGPADPERTGRPAT